MKKRNFPYASKVALIVTVVMGFALGLYLPNEKPVPVQAQGETCEIGQATIDIPVVCWAVDAVDFAIDNNLFSIVNTEDLRDAVKHYRFYNLVMSELQ